jgi:hypothetical protein
MNVRRIANLRRVSTIAAASIIFAACVTTTPTAPPSTAVQGPDRPASTGITEEQIAFWMEFRRVYDLERDRAWILNVARDNKATDDAFGVPMLAFERAEVAKSNASAQNLIPAANRFAADVPEFAGLWLENPMLILAFTDDLSAREGDVRRLFGPMVDVRVARYSLRELRAFAQRLRADDEWFKALDVDVIDISLNETANAVNLYYQAPTTSVEALVRERYGDPDWLVQEWAGAPQWTGPWGDLELTVVHPDGRPVEGKFVLRPLDPGGTAFGPAFLVDGKFADGGIAAFDWLVEINYVVDGVSRQVNRAFTVPADDVVKVHVVVDR